MTSTANQSTKTVWAIEHSSDNIWLLELLLSKWGYNPLRIKDREILAKKVDSQAVQPDLIIISISPVQTNVLKLIDNLYQEPNLRDIPLLCLCPTGGLCEFQVIAAGANDVLNKPFELEELHQRLQRLFKEEIEINFQQSQPRQEMTFLVSETESSSLIQQQQYWSEILHKYPESNAWKMLNEAGYEVFEQP